jgi:predicted small lipoprotein YifL
MAYSVSALEAFNLPMIRNKRSPLRPFIALPLSVCLALSVAGCGQRGPLYLPDKEQTEQQPKGQEAQAQASPEEDQEEKDEENS